MTSGWALENALKSKGISKEFGEWIVIAKDRPKWNNILTPISAATCLRGVSLYLVFGGSQLD